MSRKFQLVPQDMLRGLMSSNENSDKNFLQDTKQAMETLLYDPFIDPATKHAKYFSMLHNYQKQKRHLENKPIKVEVTNKGQEGFDTPPHLPIITTPGSQVGSLVDATGSAESVNITPKALSFIQEAASKSPEWHDATEPETSSKRVLPSRVPDKKQKEEDLVQELYKHMMENKNYYGITDKGKIIGDRKNIIDKSNALDTARLIVAEKRGKSFATLSPPGSRALRKRVAENPQAKAILKSAQTGAGWIPFKPEKWRRRKQ